ncbi:MAG: cob(I)yrinic acid a,c-diamide adenosyltransferase [Pirellulales bacterium]|nr:cob(I)yrinic acid a,c-diamide adenosyltransferase [Pirellulales bacterium]
MKIYTRTGDQGSTSLFGNQRVPKCDLRICAYGTVDELNAVLGVARAQGLSAQLDTVVQRLQNQLFDLGAELASPDPEQCSTEFLQEAVIAEQEAWMDAFEQQLPPLTNFILSGGTEAAATLHLARCVCRRAEREIVALSQAAAVRDLVLKYVNRTSDLLFVIARMANVEAGVADVVWQRPDR